MSPAVDQEDRESNTDDGAVADEHDFGPDPVVSVDAACHEPFRAAWSVIESRLSADLVEILGACRDAHRSLVEEVGLGREAPVEWDIRSEQLLEYRRGLASRVLEPLRDAFGADGPLALVGSELIAALGACTEASRALPEATEAAFRPGALEPRPSDGLFRRVGKFFARGLSAARKPGRTREVPLRAIALIHLDKRVAPRVDRAGEAFLESLASWSKQLEEAWAEWGDCALPALVEAELPDAEDPGAIWETVRDAARGLETDLTELMEGAPHRGAVEAARERMATNTELLEADVAVAGSFLYRPTAPSGVDPALPRVQRLTAAAIAWDEAVADRMRLYIAVLSVLSGTTAVQRRLVWRVRERSLAGAKVLPEVAASLDALAETFERSTESVEGRLASIEAEVMARLEPTASAIPGESEVEGTVDAGADTAVEALMAMVRQAPTTLRLHAEDARLSATVRRSETRVLALQELARQAFDAMRIERIRASTEALPAAIDGVRDDILELPDVFAFAFEAAKTELEEGEEDAEARAVGLVTEALRSMGESLRNGARELANSVADVQRKLANEITEGSLGLLDRVAAGRVQARLLAARSWFADLRALVNERWGPPVDRAAHWLVVRYGLLTRLVTRGLRKGSAIVSGSPTARSSSRSVKTLSESSRVLAGLPLVYQRLFTLEPLSDASLLAGRAGELAEAMDRWTRWKTEDGVPVVVRGRPGCGITSFLNVLREAIEEEGGETLGLALEARVENEESLARWLCRALKLDEVATLDDLSSSIFSAPKGSLPDAVSIDNLEHVYLRVPKGTDLIERLLTLMSETEPRIFWIGGLTDSAWQLIKTTEPHATSQIEVLDLPPLGTDQIRQAITLRHRRSGLPVRYEAPEAGRRFLRRRLRRLRDPLAHAEALEVDYFDQLARTSSGHLRLALFQWLLSADFSRGEGVLMRQPERPDFSLLEGLALTQNFTLKAFLDHRSLSIAEHDRIFRLPRHESYQIFEALGNRNLIETVSEEDGDQPSKSEIEENNRYRVRPLLVGAITNHLRTRNIVH